MTITINGSGTITGITAGGLPDAIIQTEDIVDLAVTPAKMSQKLTSGTAVASTSGTSIDFTSIPSWVKRITVMFNGVSTNGSSSIQCQIGSGSVDTSGYLSIASFTATSGSSGASAFTAGFGISVISAGTDTLNGSFTICLLNSNTWTQQGSVFRNAGTNVIQCSSGSKTLSGTLDRVRITTVNGTDTFDAGSINILYEG
jgi:hypothetical protein